MIYAVHHNNDNVSLQLEDKFSKMSQDVKDCMKSNSNLRDQIHARKEELLDWRDRFDRMDRNKRLKKIHVRDGYTLEGVRHTLLI